MQTATHTSSHTKCFVPDLVENDWLGSHFKRSESGSEFARAAAGVDQLHPACTVQSPVGMQQRSRDAAFQLEHAGTEGGKDQSLGAKRRAVPGELAGRSQAELVRQMTAFVSLVGVLVLVQCQCVGAVQVLVMLVVAVHT